MAILDVNQSSGNVLPASKRVFSADWDDGFPVYKLKQQNGHVKIENGKQVFGLQWDISKIGHLRMGHYTARLVMTYDDGTKDIPLEASVSFWVIPWRLIFAVVIPLSGVAILGYSYIRLRQRVKKLQAKDQK